MRPTRFAIVDAAGNPTGPITSQGRDFAERLAAECEQLSGEARQVAVWVESLRVPGSVAMDLHNVGDADENQSIQRLRDAVPYGGGSIRGLHLAKDIVNLAGTADFVAERMDMSGEYSIEREDIGARSAAQAAARCYSRAMRLVA